LLSKKALGKRVVVDAVAIPFNSSCRSLVLSLLGWRESLTATDRGTRWQPPSFNARFANLPDSPKFQLKVPAVFPAIGWLAVTILFSWYAANFVVRRSITGVAKGELEAVAGVETVID